MRLTTVCLGLLMSLAAMRAMPAERHALTPDDIYGFAEVSDPQVSPDGQWVAYVVSSNDRESDESRSAIWMVRWDGTQRLALTHPTEDTSRPRFSPDGRYIAYLAAPAGKDKVQIMLLDRRGGEGQAVTSVSGDIGDYSWAPDARQIVFTMTPGEAPATPKPIVIDALHFKQDGEGYLASGAERHLYLLDVDGKNTRQLTQDADFNEDLPTWSPDGHLIAFVRTKERGVDKDGREDIDVIDARPDGVMRTLVRPFAPNTQRLAWSPDGKWLAYEQGLEPKFNAYMLDRLALVPAAGGAPRTLSDSLDREVSSFAFADDGASVFITVEDDGVMYPATIDLKNGAIARQATAASVVSAISSRAGHTAVLQSTDAAPPEVYALEAGQLRKLTGHNDESLAGWQLGAVDTVKFKDKAGVEIHGLLVKPPSYVAGRKYPLVLWIHGGPHGQDEHDLILDGYQFEPQMFAAKGYLVLKVNYRGGSGRGIDFAKSIFADWSHKEVEDLLAGVDYVVASGMADPQRLAVGGWSYGGILTDATIASDRRFKAAISGAGSANQLSTFGSDEYILQYSNELGPPWKDTALWLKVSYPFFHADRIHTPTLFFGGEKDFNVPVIGGEQMYQALRVLGVPARLVIYPGQHHVVARPSYIKDMAERMLDWLGRYVPADNLKGRARSPAAAGLALRLASAPCCRRFPRAIQR